VSRGRGVRAGGLESPDVRHTALLPWRPSQHTHVKMARVQRALYQAKVDQAVRHATAGKEHSLKMYTFVVDYRQNMELPSFRKEQPGCTCYFSSLNVYNWG
jgi:hypothetical protein